MIRFNVRNLLDRVQSGIRHTTQRAEAQIQIDAPEMDMPQPAVWARRTTWVILGGLSFGIAWACLARVDVVVPARGKLEPISSSQAVQSRIGGVVTAVRIQEGDIVQQGQLLMQLDKTQLLNQLQSLSEQRERLVKRVALLRAARQGGPLDTTKLGGLAIPPELITRVQDRNLLVAQLSGQPLALAPDQMQRYTLFVQQIQDLQAVNRFQVEARQVETAGAASTAQQVKTQLEIEQTLVGQLDPLVRQGAISRTDYLRRVTGLNEIQDRYNQSTVQRSQGALNTMQAQVDGRRLVADRYREVQASLAALDNQIDDTINQDQGQLIQLKAQIRQVQEDLKAQDVRSPVNGRVFDLAVKLPGLVAQGGQALMKVTPSETLVARLQVPNTDIAALREGMPVDVRLDAYPFTDFGSISGRVTRISSDAVPADPQAQSGNPAGQTFYRVEVGIDRPFLEAKGKQNPLTPGMSLTANIKTASRPPISYVAEQFLKIFDAGQTVR
ncbi:HlyD family type I secretion periplasmic adaptor subunit [Leptolyngbya sp. AN03gr2]|uniref:HlyD family type I secretion periplasmic adaptor subunit n=1 Tax=unclassified Leptolyngbya TaxID=2650499 RepID=UPI003D31FC99